MRGLERAIVAIVFAVGIFVGLQIVRTRASVSGAPSAVAAEPASQPASQPAHELVPELRVSSLGAPERDAARTALALRRSEGSYLRELLDAHDSTNFRWPDRRHAPMRIWVQEMPVTTVGYDARFPRLVRDAFSTWGDAGVPIHLSFVLDSARAEIHVRWVDKFENAMTGRTRWVHDQHAWIVAGSIELALHQPDGSPLTADAVRAIALHEVGHLIGLDHTVDASNIMSARVSVSELSEADRRTARLVYSLPPGSLKGAAATAAPASSAPPREAPSARPPASR
ncbi:MAG TPA: matrixin family metalloprotease [Gemmatimonadaceae bacterium]|nr:matrixin family metalloprotease [Gemmatimonadaceae bacterium]